MLDLDASIAFYTEVLGGALGRREAEWADILIFDAQVTLQFVPADVTRPMPRSRHWGATLAWSDWEALIVRLTDRSFVEPPHRDYVDEPREQAKAMLADPSGNLIELKAYRNPDAVLSPSDSTAHRTARHSTARNRARAS